MAHLLVLLFGLVGASQCLDLNLQAASSDNVALDGRESTQGRTLEMPLYNSLATQRYLINISAGTPPQLFPLIFDTGSADLWLPSPSSPGCAPDPCPSPSFDPSNSSTSVDTGIPFKASFGLDPNNVMLGEFYNETIMIGGVTLPNQTLAVNKVPRLSFMAGHWGIMGAGTRYNSAAFLDPSSPVRGDPSKVPIGVWEHLYNLGYLKKKLFSVWLNHIDSELGSVLFGGIDNEKYEGELKSVPVILEGPDELLIGWAVNLTSVVRIDGRDGNVERLTNDSWSIRTTVDSGAPALYLPTDLYDAIAAPLNATIFMQPNGVPTPYIPCSFGSSTTSLEFGFPGRNGEAGPIIRVPFHELVYPFGLPKANGEIRAPDGTELCYFGVIPNEGEIFLIGATLLRSAYVVFDIENSELRMAKARKDGYGKRRIITKSSF